MSPERNVQKCTDKKKNIPKSLVNADAEGVNSANVTASKLAVVLSVSCVILKFNFKIPPFKKFQSISYPMLQRYILCALVAVRNILVIQSMYAQAGCVQKSICTDFPSLISSTGYSRQPWSGYSDSMEVSLLSGYYISVEKSAGQMQKNDLSMGCFSVLLILKCTFKLTPLLILSRAFPAIKLKILFTTY